MSSVMYKMLETEEEMPSLDLMVSDSNDIDLNESSFQSFCFNEDFSDISIVCNGYRYPAHRIILAKKSRIFMDSFKARPNCKTIAINNCGVEAVKQFIQFIYGKPLVWNMNMSTATSLYQLAKEFEVFDLAPIISSEVVKVVNTDPDFIKVDTFCSLIRFIDDNNMSEIRSKVMLFGAQNIEQILYIEIANFRSKEDIKMLINKFNVSPSKVIDHIPHNQGSADPQRINDFEDLIDLSRCRITDLINLHQKGLFRDENLLNLAKIRAAYYEN